MVGPVGEVEGEIFISVAPVVADALVAFDNEGVDSESLESGGDMKTTDRLLASPKRTPKMRTHQ